MYRRFTLRIFADRTQGGSPVLNAAKIAVFPLGNKSVGWSRGPCLSQSHERVGRHLWRILTPASTPTYQVPVRTAPVSTLPVPVSGTPPSRALAQMWEREPPLLNRKGRSPPLADCRAAGRCLKTKAGTGSSLQQRSSFPAVIHRQASNELSS